MDNVLTGAMSARTTPPVCDPTYNKTLIRGLNLPVSFGTFLAGATIDLNPARVYFGTRTEGFLLWICPLETRYGRRSRGKNRVGRMRGGRGMIRNFPGIFLLPLWITANYILGHFSRAFTGFSRHSLLLWMKQSSVCSVAFI